MRAAARAAPTTTSPLLRTTAALLRTIAPLFRVTAGFLRMTAALFRVTAGFLRTTAAFFRTTAGFLRVTAALLQATAALFRTTAGFLRVTAGFLRTSAGFLRTTAARGAKAGGRMDICLVLTDRCTPDNPHSREWVSAEQYYCNLVRFLLDTLARRRRAGFKTRLLIVNSLLF